MLSLPRKLHIVVALGVGLIAQAEHTPASRLKTMLKGNPEQNGCSLSKPGLLQTLAMLSVLESPGRGHPSTEFLYSRYDDLIKSDLSKGSMPESWGEYYWPTYKLGLANRWLAPGKLPPLKPPRVVGKNEDERTKAVEEALENSHRLVGKPWEETVFASPSEKHDLVFRHGFSLTKNELSLYQLYRESIGESGWEWFGACDGAARVGSLLDVPLHAVLLRPEDQGQPVFFSVADIKALHTKAADIFQLQPAEGSETIGTLCHAEDNELIRDENGRVLDGAIGVGWENSAGKWRGQMQEAPHLPVRLEEEQWDYPERWLTFRVGPDFENSKLYWLQIDEGVFGSRKTGGNLFFRTKIFTTKKGADGKVQKDLPIPLTRQQAQTSAERAAREELLKNAPESFRLSNEINLGQFIYSKNCRDVNPLYLHLLLANYFSDRARKQGTPSTDRIYLESARGRQLWNYPVKSFEIRLGKLTPLPPKNTHPGDPYAGYRAVGTKAIADAYLRVDYARQGKPELVPEPRPSVKTVIYHYTLDIDKEGRAIGAELHSAPLTSDFSEINPKSGNQLFTELEAEAKTRPRLEEAPFPDVAYHLKTPVRFGQDYDHLIDTWLLKTLHEASTNQALPKKTAIIEGQAVPYVEISAKRPKGHKP